MTLRDIRECRSFEDIKPAIEFLSEHMQFMTWGEFNAYKRTIEYQAEKLGISRTAINEYAENCQIFGYQPVKE